MDRSKRTQIMGIILSSGLAFSGLGYAQNNTDTSTTTNQETMPTNGTQDTMQTNGAQGTIQTNGTQDETMPGTTQDQGAQVVPDSQLQSQVKSALKEYSEKVQVQVNNGVVALSGQVESDTDYENVITLAESVKGVQDVTVDNLTVKDSKSPLNDAYITAKVKGALIQKDLFDTDIPSWSIGVETKNGKVFLSGKAASEAEKQQIMQVVKSVKGVQSVDDQIQISSVADTGTVTNGDQQQDQNGTTTLDSDATQTNGSAQDSDNGTDDTTQY
ncbi:BON domain-containing protein [Legionella israelensis]|uniref:Osmotically inducible protein Y n=1 Tax=Legionella israelensis TaxID=454 RepID=A0A0W0VS96_9GAMM|nr:BON domain-containing protein [Legionella israelensis]KTD22987.1 osmotically inducible protein Y [Legionella israelensis]QBS08909.1 BON domain-containing protein [Legionella israelensis]SCX82797.1 hyperosmotically inducible protein [Legionella israelensis DSM 19235]STX58597.1 osmotically inducible protein Y [Legionella israelensis]